MILQRGKKKNAGVLGGKHLQGLPPRIKGYGRNAVRPRGKAFPLNNALNTRSFFQKQFRDFA